MAEPVPVPVRLTDLFVFVSVFWTSSHLRSISSYQYKNTLSFIVDTLYTCQHDGLCTLAAACSLHSLHAFAIMLLFMSK